MRDVQTALSPVAPSLGQLTQPKAPPPPDGSQPFSKHLDLLLTEEAPKLGSEERVTGAADAAVDAFDVPIGALSAGTAAPYPDGKAPDQRDVPVLPPSRIGRHPPDQAVPDDGSAPQRQADGGEARADGLGAPSGRVVSEGRRDGHMMTPQVSEPDAARIQVASRKVQLNTDPKTTTSPQAEQAETVLREVPVVDRAGAARTSGPVSAVPPPGPDLRIMASSEASGEIVQPAKSAEGIEQGAALRPEVTKAGSTPRPAPELPKRERSAGQAGAGRTPPEAQINVETRGKTAARVPAVVARPEADAVARGGFAQTFDTKEMPGKSSGMTVENEMSGGAASAPTVTARGVANIPPTAASDIPRHIAVQLADAMPQAPGREVEISLNPQELGRVRISLNANDAGVTMAITAERGETLDLMRRHIDQLAQEFHDMGYGDVSFSFGQSGKGQEQDDPQAIADKLAAPDQQGMPLDPAAPPRPIASASGLDLRI